MPAAALSPHAFLSALQPVARAPRWWVAFSGGLDSTVLLHLLAELKECDPALPPLGAIHVNHHLRAESDLWQRHCLARCEALGVTLEVAEVRVNRSGSGLEAAAREARYRVFESILGSGEALFLGHHQDDQVETLMLRLLRGAGLNGLGAMSPARSLGRGTLQRPLLDLPRSELAAYAAARRLSYIDDPSNADCGLDRNYLRHQVLPLLAQRWPAYATTLTRAASHLRDAARDLDASAPGLPRCRNRMGDPGLRLAPLLAMPDSCLARTLRRWLAELGQPVAPDTAALAEWVRQLRAAGGGGARFQFAGLELGRFQDALYVLPPADAFDPSSFPVVCGEVQDIPGVGVLELVPAASGAPSLAGEGPLSWRWRRGGERLRLPGRAGSRSLKQLLQEAGVPPWWRERLPLLYCGEQLVAVADLWLCDGPWLAPGKAGWQVRWQRKSFLPAD